MNARQLCVWLCLPLIALSAAGGEKPAAPEVEVVQPVTREVNDYEEFTGRIEASASVVIRARVTGYLEKVLFKEGAEVKKGDVLFEIDPGSYKADVKKAEAAVTVAQAALARAEGEVKRTRGLRSDKVVGKGEMDKTESARDEAKARLQLARADLQKVTLYLGYTKVTAPISGRIGRCRVGPGNLVRADETDLATVVQTKRMSACFDIGERTALRLWRAKVKGLPVTVGLADEMDFPRRSEVDFVGNRVDPRTGTVRLRAPLPNEDGLLRPGLSVRVRLKTGAHKVLLAPERAVVQRLGTTAWLFVVNQKNKVEFRQVEVGEVPPGQRRAGLVVVKEGLRDGDRFVLKGAQGLKEGMAVRPKQATPPAEK